MFFAYIQLALEVKKNMNLQDLLFEGILFALVLVWALIIVPYWRELRLLSLGILFFLLGNFSDLLDRKSVV